MRAVETEESVGDWQIEKISVDFSPLLLKKIDVSREGNGKEAAQQKQKPCVDDHTGRKDGKSRVDDHTGKKERHKPQLVSTIVREDKVDLRERRKSCISDISKGLWTL